MSPSPREELFTHEAQRVLMPPSKVEKIINVGGGQTTVRTPGNLDELLRVSRVVCDSCKLSRIIIHCIR